MNLSKFEKYFPYFKDRYTFDICPAERVDDLRIFINEYWKKNHIFARSPEFLKWQHYDKENDRYNFIIAIHKATNEIHAIAGFTSSSHFDSKIKEPVRWGNIWKSKLINDEPGLGLMVEFKAEELLKNRNLGTVGIGLSKISKSIWGKTINIGLLNQYYILHPNKTDFKIAILTQSTERYSKNATYSDKIIKDCYEDTFNHIDEVLLQSIPSHKSKTYYINRFFRHPIYKYYATAIYNLNGKAVGIFFWRFCFYESAKCIRIVDYFGFENALQGCLNGFLDLLCQHEAEYIDFMCANIPVDMIEAAGFLDRKNQENIIIPNYFEPFVQSNIDVYFCENSFNGAIFKGDSDQDRPS